MIYVGGLLAYSLGLMHREAKLIVKINKYLKAPFKMEKSEIKITRKKTQDMAKVYGNGIDFICSRRVSKQTLKLNGPLSK